MGTYYTAKSLIGYKVSTNCFQEITERIVGCSHRSPQGTNFCPTCGTKIETVRKRTTSSRGWDFFAHIQGTSKFCTEYNDNSDVWYIGYGVHAELEEANRVDFRDAEQIKSDIRDFLKDYLDVIELEEASFGLWCTLIGH